MPFVVCIYFWLYLEGFSTLIWHSWKLRENSSPTSGLMQCVWNILKKKIFLSVSFHVTTHYSHLDVFYLLSNVLCNRCENFFGNTLGAFTNPHYFITISLQIFSFHEKLFQHFFHSLTLSLKILLQPLSFSAY